MQIIDPELGDITHLVEEVLREGLFQAEIAAMRRQRMVQKALDERNRHTGGRHALGQRVAAVDPVIYNHWEKVAGKGCWGDKSERNSILKFAPELRAPSQKRGDFVGGNDTFAKAYDRNFCRGAVLIDGTPATATCAP